MSTLTRTAIPRPSLTRTGSRLLEAVLVVAMIPAAVFGVAAPLLGPAALGWGTSSVFGAIPSIPVTIDTNAVAISTAPLLPQFGGDAVERGDGLEFSGPTGAKVNVWFPDRRQQLGLVGAPVLRGLVTLAVLFLLLLIVRTLRRGDPFVPANARRLLAIAALVTVGGEGASLLALWGRVDILANPRVAPYVVREYSISWTPLLAGLAIAVGAEVFRRGTALRHDVDGLV